MNVLIINPIMYTPPEAGMVVPRRTSIKHTLFYNMAIGFLNNGNQVTLICSDEYRPTEDNSFDFNIVFLENIAKKHISRFPNGFPILSGLRRFLVKHHLEYDRVIVSESFSQAAFWASIICPEKTIIWQEVASFVPGKQLASFIWYNFVVRVFMRKSKFVGRSNRAISFLKKYSHNVHNYFVEHGINCEVFKPVKNKEPYFVVLAQLIPRKRIDKTIGKFAEFCNNVSKQYTLHIVGGGPMEEELKFIAKNNGVDNMVIFHGLLNQQEVSDCLSRSLLMLVDSAHEYCMVSILESIASCTPVITNSIPYNSDEVFDNVLGIQDDNWDFKTIQDVLKNYELYYSNCMKYREKLSYEYVANTLLMI